LLKDLRVHWRDAQREDLAVMLQEEKHAVVYRICPGAENTWCVYADAFTQPVACFNEKSAAVRHALGLARGRTRWHGHGFPQPRRQGAGEARHT
jgi:hypothetical protein